MQPPPRKVKPNIALKNTHADQVSKLQAKHQQECDLLEDIRTFFLRKSALEKEYAQGLLKVTSQLLKREFPAQPDISTEDGLEHKTVCTVWRSILEESDRLAKTRLQAAEVYSEKAAEPLKPAKASKAQSLKKVVPQLGVIQAEVAQCVSDMVKAHKAYNTESSVAHEARQKSSEAEDKLKRKSTGIFQSLSGLQKTCTKLRSRTEASEVKETSTRNDYVLSQAAANAHHLRYYSTDIPDLMKTLDSDIYEKIQESLTVAGQTAAEIAQAEATSFQTIATEAAKICREFSHQCYLFQNPVFTNLVQYQFEPCHEDPCNKISSDHGAGPDLDREARKWSTKVAKETRAIRDYYRQLTLLQNGKTMEKASESGSQESTQVDPETKTEELKQSIRKAETSKLKAEARLDVLRAGDVNVDDWINQAQMESLVADEKGLARTPSQVSLRTESSGGQSANDDHEGTYTNYDDDDDFIDDTFNTSGNRSGRAYPIFCKALYDFEASNYDEMTIRGGEELELIADGDGEGWVKAKNSLGQEGYIPETYVDVGGLSDNPAPLGVDAMNAINEGSTNMGNGSDVPSTEASVVAEPAYTQSETYTYQESSAYTQSETYTYQESSEQQQEEPVQAQQPSDALKSPDLQSPTSTTASPYSSGDLEVQQSTVGQQAAGEEGAWARALYDYEAQTEEELSFVEGAIIRIVRKDDNGVDDGFWEGECQGRVGVFPSLVVEEIVDPSQATKDPLSPGVMSLPPDFSVPPPVHVTLPTPDAEPPPPPSLANGEDSQNVQISSTADQSPKRVRFSGEGARLSKCGTEKKKCPLSVSKQVGAGSKEEQEHPSRRKLLQWMYEKQRQQVAERERVRAASSNVRQPEERTAPILRHKSLPSCLESRIRQSSPQCSGNQQIEQQLPVSSPPTRNRQKQQPSPHRSMPTSPSSPEASQKHCIKSISSPLLSCEGVVTGMLPPPGNSPKKNTQQHPSKTDQVSDQQQRNNCEQKVDRKFRGHRQTQQSPKLGRRSDSAQTQQRQQQQQQQQQRNSQSMQSPQAVRKQCNQQQHQQRMSPQQSPRVQRRGHSIPKVNNAMVSGPNTNTSKPPDHKAARQQLALALSHQQQKQHQSYNQGHRTPTSPVSSPSSGPRSRPASPLTIPPSYSSNLQQQQLSPSGSNQPSFEPLRLNQVVTHADVHYNIHQDAQHYPSHYHQLPGGQLSRHDTYKFDEVGIPQSRSNIGNVFACDLSPDQFIPKVLPSPVMLVRHQSSYDAWDSEEGEESLV